MVEAECRLLHRLLEEAETQERKSHKVHHRAPRGAVKYKNGQPVTCDGRELTTDEEGNSRFVDNGTMLAGYLVDLKARHRAQAIGKRDKERVRFEAIQRLAGIEVGGREVVQDEKGNDIFADDKSLVSAYLRNLRKKGEKRNEG
jgi:hypothetical protein